MNNNRQINFSDRIAIETGIYKGDSFKKIAKAIGKHPSSVSHEVLTNRSQSPGMFSWGKNCKYAAKCKVTKLCEKMGCTRICKTCDTHDCQEICSKRKVRECGKINKPPYVCNTCEFRKKCPNEKYFYSVQYAERISSQRRSSSRKGIHTKGTALKELVRLTKENLKDKKQPVAHFYQAHKEELTIGLRSLYNYIKDGVLKVKPTDLRRMVTYNKRKVRHKEDTAEDMYHEYRVGRTYSDFETFVKNNGLEERITEMDTVIGKRGHNNRLLTMFLRQQHVMLIFLIPDGRAESVERVFNSLEAALGTERFRRLFPVILTDNGSEFKRVESLETSINCEYRTHIFYCNPMASWQKGALEKNHEFIRYVIPKGTDISSLSQEDITLLMNHINSIKREKLGGRCPYELLNDEDEDITALKQVLKMHLIPADEVHLKPSLLKK